MTAFLARLIMRIEVIKKFDYKGCPIYIRRMDTLFEYLVIYKGELYEEYFDIKPSKIRQSPLLKDYSKKQLDNIVKMVYFAAYKTIDKLKKN